MLYINQRKRLRRIVLGILAIFPAMDAYIRRETRIVDAELITELVASELTSLSPRARRIYSNLKVASQNNNRRNY